VPCGFLERIKYSITALTSERLTGVQQFELRLASSA
jgi:hypothetical protein